MPLLKHAKKKLRQDNKREIQRKKIKTLYKSLVKKAKTAPTPEAVSSAFQAIDKAAKINIIHDNKAARLKSALAKVDANGEAPKAAPTAKSAKAKAKIAKATRAKAAAKAKKK